jgi:hypothetical protein
MRIAPETIDRLIGGTSRRIRFRNGWRQAHPQLAVGARR